MCKREADFLIKVYYLYASSAIKKSTCTLKQKLIKKTKKNSGLQSQNDFPSIARTLQQEVNYVQS